MQRNTLRPHTKKRPKTRIGRGGKRGTFSGRGTKGQKARAGRHIRPAIRDIIKKIPKKRGYGAARFASRPIVVNVGTIDPHFASNDRVTPETLAQKGLVLLPLGKKATVKLLGSGAVTKPLLVSSCQISASAREKIVKAGGSVSS